jgi:hypothetical protein
LTAAESHLQTVCLPEGMGREARWQQRRGRTVPRIACHGLAAVISLDFFSASASIRKSRLAALLNLAPFVAYKVDDGTDN